MTTATVCTPTPTGVTVHRFASLANPYLVCRRCRRQVTAWHNAARCGCGPAALGANVPCGHPAGVESVCPSWTHTGGCNCRTALRRIEHPPVAWLKARKAVADV